MARLQPRGQIAQQIHYLPGIVLNVFGLARIGQGGGGQLIAARSPAHAQVNAAGIEGIQQAKGFGDFQGAVVGQHNAAAAHPDGFGVGRHRANEGFRAGAGKVGQVVMFGQPVAAIAQGFDGDGQVKGVPQGIGRRLAGPHRRLVDHAQSKFPAQKGSLLRGE